MTIPPYNFGIYSATAVGVHLHIVASLRLFVADKRAVKVITTQIYIGGGWGGLLRMAPINKGGQLN